MDTAGFNISPETRWVAELATAFEAVKPPKRRIQESGIGLSNSEDTSRATSYLKNFSDTFPFVKYLNDNALVSFPSSRANWEPISTMETDDVVQNLTYLSQYLDESRARVGTLEKELEDLRSEKSSAADHNGRLGQLEAENVALRQRLADTVKIKIDKVEPSSDGVSLAETRQSKEALQAKCSALEARVKDSAELATKAMCDRVEADKASSALAAMRLESQEVKKQIADLQRTCAELSAANVALSEANDSALSKLRAKRDSCKAQKTSLRAVSDDLEAQNAALRTETKELKQEVIALQEDANANADAGKKCVSLENELAELQKEVNAVTKNKGSEVNVEYRRYMAALPVPERLPHFAQLDPIGYKDSNLHAYLAQDPAAKSFLNHILYLPGRTILISGAAYLAFGPTQRYQRTTQKWTEGSDLTGFHGGTRELFVNRKEFIVYMGSYKCHDLSTLCPGGTSMPAGLSRKEILDAALGVPRPTGHAQIIKQCFPDGVIKVEATGLQCVGFNHQLYDSLRRMFAKHGKREAEDDGRDTSSKSRKLNSHVSVKGDGRQ
ncbi:hypothetical protein B0H11DRAFT_1913681 [Mycena galericulata]|nr:hypothetical protein B0H11DRAFT_1913681 [Mycena galericulata]